MLTEFGKELRKLRIDRELRLLDLAEKLRISVATLSAYETGRRPIPDDFIGRLATALSLNVKQIRTLEDALTAQSNSVEIPLSGNQHNRSRDLAIAFARNFGKFDQGTIDELLTNIETKFKKRD